MVDPKFHIKEETTSPTYGKYSFEPLEQGYGHTLGVSLRRVLLTSLKGAAITKVKIDGVKHQFSSISGLKEDVIQLILNIKKVRIKLDSDKPVTAKLNIKGSTKFYAKDIVCPDAEVINKELYLGELTSGKSKLNMELTVEPGFGYVTAEEYSGSKELNTIVLDALYSSIERVNYKVEATRVGRMTNLDRLVLEVWTDGTISPYDAIKESAKILVSFFIQIYEPKAKASESVAVTPAISEEVLKMTLEELDLQTRIVNALHNGGIDTVGQLLGTPKKELYKIKNLGAKSITNIEEILRKKGIALTV